MSAYPVLEHEGFCASVTTKKEATGRWMCWVAYTRGSDTSALASSDRVQHRIPNDFPNEEAAVLAGYARARELISRELVKQ